MKVWLNDLKEGDIFYHIIFQHIYKCQHLGDAQNHNFKMPRIKYKIIDEEFLVLKVLGPEYEAFVNQYVYDDYDSALDALKVELKKDYDLTIKSIAAHKQKIDDLEKEAERLKKLITKYAK